MYTNIYKLSTCTDTKYTANFKEICAQFPSYVGMMQTYTPKMKTLEVKIKAVAETEFCRRKESVDKFSFQLLRLSRPISPYVSVEVKTIY